MNRRAFIGTTAGIGVAGLAGCIAGATPAPAEVPEDRLEAGGWELLQEEEETVFDDEFAGQEVTATAFTQVYGNVDLQAELNEGTLGQVPAAPATFFASRVTFDPDVTNLPGGIGRDQIVDQVEEESRETLQSQMRDGGVEGIERTGTGSLSVETGETARHTEFAGQVPFGPLEFPVADGEVVEVDGEPLQIAGELAVWHRGESVLVAGGAYPAEVYDETIEEDLSEAITVSVEIDLGLDPDAYEAELFDLITAVK